MEFVIIFQIGDREWVGYGFNGRPNYVDRNDFPLPAVRFRADTPDVKVIFFKTIWHYISHFVSIVI